MKQHPLSKSLSTLLSLSLVFQLGLPAMAAGSGAPPMEDSEVVSTYEYSEEALAVADNDLIGDVIPPEEDVVPASVGASAAVGPFSVSAAYQADYDAAFRAYASSVVNNGGKYGSSVIGNLIDGNIKTHWETGKPNTDAFQNSVTVTFAETVELGSVVYYPRVQGAANKGFPTAFSIYGSQSVTGEDFELVCSGAASVAAGGTQISFEPTSFLRLRFVFEEASQSWAAAAELAFYRPDPLVKLVDGLFADGTMSSLKPQYQDMNVLNELLEKAQVNPNKALLEKVQMAVDIQSGAADYAKDVFALEQRGDGVYHARTELQMSSYGTNMLPTGLAARPGEIVTVYVDADEGAPLPTIVFTQQIGHYANWQRQYTLQQGENTFTVPRIFSDSWSTKTIPGGAIYLLNPYTAEDQGSAPRIRIVGGHDYPLFQDGDDVDAFLAELSAYNQELADHPDTTVDIVELYSDLIILTGNMQAANPFLNGTQDPQTTISFHNTRITQMLEYAGLDESSPLHSRGTSRAMIRLMQPFAAGYAASDHVGVQQGSINTFFKGVMVGWVYAHELGHTMDMMGGKVPEVTNNMWANHIIFEIQGEADRIRLTDYDKIFRIKGSDNYRSLTDGVHDMGMWWQLHLMDENYWPNYQRAYREGVAADMELTNRERMAVVSSYALGVDVIAHFERYGFMERSSGVDAALSTLGVPAAAENIKPWYMWTKATQDRESVFEETYTPEITSVERSGGSLKVTVNIDDSADAALLGYEIRQDGTVLGFSRTAVFTTPYFTDDGQDHVYTVQAYDLRLNTSAVSTPFTINLDAPVIHVTGGTLAVIHQEFDPLSIVQAADKDGTDLTDNIQVVSGAVDTGTRGVYPITYSVTDANGLTGVLTVEITVVSGVRYVSDLQEASVQVGWKTLRKDTNISGGPITLLQGGVPVTYPKGLGAHASSSVVYDLTGKGFTWFESYVGIDRAVAGKNANAIFRVLVDGVVRYDSGAMTPADNARYVKLNIAGASTVELVADSNGANSNDHTVWAGARFALDSSAPVIHAQDTAFTSPADVDLHAITAAVTAEDVEDGDLTASLTYTTDYVPGRTGAFTITYSVTDSDGNTTEAVRNLVVVNAFVYVSDQDWVSAKVGYGSIRRDRSLNGNPIKLSTADGTYTYDKGLGVHARSEVVYDLTGKDFYYFESDVGADATAANGNTSVVFEVYVDGVLAAETPLMRKGMPAGHILVSLAGASTLKLVVTAGGNGNANDHANWADAKFLTAVPEADKAALAAAVERAYALDGTAYTADTWAVLTWALAEAEAVLAQPGASQAEVDASLDSLTGAVDGLKRLVDSGELESLLALARSIGDAGHAAPGSHHPEGLAANLNAAVADAEATLQNPAVTQEEVDRWSEMIRYFIWDLNPEFTPGWQPPALDRQ